jgi:MFS family permease
VNESKQLLDEWGHIQLERNPSGANRQTELRPGALQVAATAFVVLFCIVGLALWGLPFYYDFMVQQFGWTRAQVTSGNALSKLVVGPVFGFIAGWIIDRFGTRRVMMAGIVMAGGALVGLGWVSTLGMFYFFYFFNALGYVCGGPLPTQVLLSRWFDKSRGKAMGFAYLGIGIGGATVPWISHALIQHLGWQSALQSLGVLIIVVSFPLAFFVKEAPSPPTSDRKVSGSADVMAAFKTRPFYLLTFGSMCSIAAVSGTQQNLKLFLSLDRHFSQGDAAEVLSLVLSFSIVGRLLMGWMADRFSKKYVMLLTYLLVATGIPFLFLSHSQGVYVAAAVFGIGLGGDYMIIPLMTAEIFGMQVLGRLLGVILTAGGIAEAVSPWLTGRLRDATGNYSESCFVLMGIALLGAAVVLGLPQRRKVT